MKSILLIEDDPFLIDIYTAKFKEAGLKLDVATDGDEGWRMIQAGAYDILLLDIVLPQSDGWEILAKVRQTASLKNLKVVVLSNLGQKAEVEKGLKLGAAKYIIKAHYTPSEVVEEVKKILD
jgi:DNA-binding response OmpR family regulator